MVYPGERGMRVGVGPQTGHVLHEKKSSYVDGHDRKGVLAYREKWMAQ